MADKRFREFVRHCEKWRKRLWLGAWDIVYEPVEKIDDGPANSDTYTSLAETETVADYLNATVRFRVPPRGRGTLPSIEHIACHEMVHILLATYTDFVVSAIDHAHESDRAQLKERHDEAKERTVTYLERILMARRTA